MARRDLEVNHVNNRPYFHLKGVSIVGRGPNGIVPIGREKHESHRVVGITAGSIQIKVLCVVSAAFFDCDHFRDGVCLVYDNGRPYDPCIQFPVEECGRSSFASPQIKRQTLEEIAIFEAALKPTVDEAIDDFMTRIRR